MILKVHIPAHLRFIIIGWIFIFFKIKQIPIRKYFALNFLIVVEAYFELRNPFWNYEP